MDYFKRLEFLSLQIVLECIRLTEIAVNGVYTALVLETLISVNLLEMWNVRSFYRVASLITISKELSKYKLDVVECRRLDGRRVASNQQENIRILVGKGE
jgi:hypothetical protein